MAIKTYTIKNKQGEVLGELHFDPLSEITVIAYRTMYRTHLSGMCLRSALLKT